MASTTPPAAVERPRLIDPAGFPDYTLAGFALEYPDEVATAPNAMILAGPRPLAILCAVTGDFRPLDIERFGKTASTIWPTAEAFFENYHEHTKVKELASAREVWLPVSVVTAGQMRAELKPGDVVKFLMRDFGRSMDSRLQFVISFVSYDSPSRAADSFRPIR